MKCPHCNNDISGLSCPECSEIIPEESRYCLYCGAMVRDLPAPEDVVTGENGEDEFDFKNRIPCSDGNCIGIIINGRCNICGKPSKRSKK
jgi:hypothetical protein